MSALLLAVIALRVSPADLSERWQIGGPDGVLHYVLFTNSTQAFAYATNPALGFPAGLNAFFTAQIDVQSALAMSVLAAATHDGIIAQNVFALGTFATAALGGYLFFRALRIRRWLSALFGVLFSLAPYHFIRIAYGHTFIANYWVVPLAGILVLMAAGPRTDPFAGWAGRAMTRRGRVVRTAVPPVILSIVVASGSPYYFVFAVIVVCGVWMLAALTALLNRPDGRTSALRASARSAPAPAALVLFVGITLAVMSGGYGVRYASYSAGRVVAESEYYAGKLMSLLLPWQGSAVPGAARLANHYAAESGVLQTTEAPGSSIIASIGIVALFAVVFIAVFAGARRAQQIKGGGPDGWLSRLLQDARVTVVASAMLWAFLFFIVSGLGVVVAMVAGPQIRAWGRLSIFLILFGLAFVAVALNSVSRRRVLVLATTGVIVVAAFDQIVGVGSTLPLNPTADAETKAYVAAADAALPDGCGVVQLPLTSFPESGSVGAMPEHEQAMPFLYSRPGSLKWSYGSVAGTYGWNIWKGATDPASFAAAVSASGACAISVNLDGYSDNPDAWKVDVVAAGADAEHPIVTSPSGTILLFAATGRPQQ